MSNELNKERQKERKPQVQSSLPDSIGTVPVHIQWTPKYSQISSLSLLINVYVSDHLQKILLSLLSIARPYLDIHKAISDTNHKWQCISTDMKVYDFADYLCWSYGKKESQLKVWLFHLFVYFLFLSFFLHSGDSQQTSSMLLVCSAASVKTKQHVATLAWRPISLRWHLSSLPSVRWLQVAKQSPTTRELKLHTFLWRFAGSLW